MAIQQPPSSALPTELPVVATEAPTAATPPATRIDQLTQMRDALQVQQQPQPQVVTPAIGENAITPAPSPPITDETIRGLVDQVSGYPGIDAHKAKLEKNPTLVDAYDRQVAKLPQMAQRVLNYGPVREKLLIGDSVDTGALKAITEIFGLPATVFNAMSKLNTAWYKSKGIGAEVATPEIPFEGADLRRMGSAILGVRPGELDAPKGHLQVIQRIAEELTGTVIATPILRKAIPAIRAMSEAEFARFAAQQAQQAVVSGGAAGVVRNITDNPVAELVAQLMGGTGTAVAQAMSPDKAMTVLRSIRGFFTGGNEQNMRARVENALREALAHEAKTLGAAQTARDVERLVPGVHLPLGERTQSRTVLQAQIALMEKSPEFRATMDAAREGNLDALAAALQHRMGQAAQGVTPEDIRQALIAGEGAASSGQFGPAYEAMRSTERTGQQNIGALDTEMAKVQKEARTFQAQGALQEESAQQSVEHGERVVEQTKIAAQKQQEQLARHSAMVQKHINKDMDAAQDALERHLDTLSGTSGEPQGPLRERLGGAIRAGVKKAWKALQSETGKLSRAVDPHRNIEDAAGTFYDAAVGLKSSIDANMKDIAAPRSLNNFLFSLRKRALEDKGIPFTIPPISDTMAQSVENSALDLETLVRKLGGIKTEGEELTGELRALTNRETGTTGLVNNKSGKPLQDVANAAQEAGLLDTADTQELIDVLNDSVVRGVKRYSRFIDGEQQLFARYGGDGIVQEMETAAEQLTPDDFRNVNLTFRDMMDLRSRILYERRALVGNEHARERQLLNQFEETVWNKMKLMAQKAAAEGDPSVLQRYDDFRSFYQQNIGKFTSGIGEDILARERYSAVDKIPDAELVSRAWLSGDRSRAPLQQVLAILSDNNPESTSAIDALWTYVTNDFYKKVVNQDTKAVIPKNYKAWMDRHALQLDLLPPSLRDQLTTTHGLHGVVEEVRNRANVWAQNLLGIQTTAEEQAAQKIGAAESVLKEAQKSQQAVAKQAGEDVGKAASRVDQLSRARQKVLDDAEQQFQKAKGEYLKTAVGSVMGSDNPEQAIHAILQRDTYARNRDLLALFKAAGDNDQATQGILWLIWQDFAHKNLPTGTPATAAGTPILDPGKLQQFLNEYKPVIMRAIPDQTKDLQTIATGIAMARSGEKLPSGIKGKLPPALAPDTSDIYQWAREAIGIRPVVGVSVGLAYLLNHPLIGLGILGGGLYANLWNRLHDAQKLRLVGSIFSEADAAKTVALMMTPTKKPSLFLPRIYTTMINLGVGSRTDEPGPTAQAQPQGGPQ